MMDDCRTPPPHPLPPERLQCKLRSQWQRTKCRSRKARLSISFRRSWGFDAFHRERKGFFSRAQGLFIVSANLCCRDEKGSRSSLIHATFTLQRIKSCARTCKKSLGSIVDTDKATQNSIKRVRQQARRHPILTTDYTLLYIAPQK